MELGFFQETKFTVRIQTCKLEGYHVLAADAPIWYHRLAALFFRDTYHFQVKVFHPHRPNVTSFQLASRRGRWFILGYYLAPYDASTINSNVIDVIQCPGGAGLLVARDFNADLAALEGNCRV